MKSSLKKHKVAESAKINQLLAESTHFGNGFLWLLTHAQRLAGVVDTHHDEELNVKT